MKLRSRQRGFIYLRTGANGAGKTLFTLLDVRERQIKESRPVAYNGRFDMVADFGWKKIDAKDWQLEPDGTIFLFDECHNDMPKRGANEAVPDHVKMLAEHRRRGFDFYLITQHPMNIDAFVRRLIGEPGWHSHLKRTPGAAMVSELRWAAVKEQCEKPGSGATGEVTMRPFPKEVFKWYNSATLHTAKPKLPRAFWIALACVILVPILGYFAFTSFTGSMSAKQAKLGAPAAGASAPRSPRAFSGGRQPATGPAGPSLSATDYVALRTPRLPGFPHTAPAFDAVTSPAHAPYPAACLSGKSPKTKREECSCYSQQGTKLQVPADVCGQIVANGFFIEWNQPVSSSSMALAVPQAGGAAPRLVGAAPGPVQRSAAPPGVPDGSAPVLLASPTVQSPPDDPSAVRVGEVIGAMRRGERRF